MAIQQSDIFLEEISQRVLLILHEHMAGELLSVASDMVASDEEFYTAMGLEVPETTLLAPRTWLVGAHPPVLEQGIEGLTFPSISSVCFRKGETTQGTGGDQFDFIPHHGYVEAIVASQDFDEAGRIAKRYGKALHRIITDHKTLDGISEPLQITPDAQVSPTYPVGASNTGPGEIYLAFAKVEFVFEVIQVRN